MVENLSNKAISMEGPCVRSLQRESLLDKESLSPRLLVWKASSASLSPTWPLPSSWRFLPPILGSSECLLKTALGLSYLGDPAAWQNRLLWRYDHSVTTVNLDHWYCICNWKQPKHTTCVKSTKITLLLGLSVTTPAWRWDFHEEQIRKGAEPQWGWSM